MRRVWINPRDYKIIGERLAAARKKTGVTQVELGRRLGKPQSFVSDYEIGDRRIDLLELGKIAQALGRDVHDLFNEVLDGVVPAGERDSKRDAARKLRRRPKGR